MRTMEQREKLVRDAAKIIGPTVIQRGEIEAELFRYEEKLAAANRRRARNSHDAAIAVRRFAAALRRLKAASSQLPEDYQLLLSADDMIRRLEFIGESLGKKVMAVDGRIEIKAGTPLRAASAKEYAAKAALRICMLHKIEPTTTKSGKYCKLAAVVFGDRRADLQYHCRRELRSAKPNASENPDKN
jgi:hypothetical protein